MSISADKVPMFCGDRLVILGLFFANKVFTGNPSAVWSSTGWTDSLLLRGEVKLIDNASALWMLMNDTGKWRLKWKMLGLGQVGFY